MKRLLTFTWSRSVVVDTKDDYTIDEVMKEAFKQVKPLSGDLTDEQDGEDETV